MVNPSPTDQVKYQIRQVISQAFKQFRGKISDNQWREFESFFWKVRPLVEIDYAQFESPNQTETSGPNLQKSSQEIIHD